MANLACGYCSTETLPDAEAADGFCKVLLPPRPPCLPFQQPPFSGTSPPRSWAPQSTVVLFVFTKTGECTFLQLAFITSSTSTELNTV